MQKDHQFEFLYNIRDDQWDNYWVQNFKNRDFTPSFKKICSPYRTNVELFSGRFKAISKNSSLESMFVHVVKVVVTKQDN